MPSRLGLLFINLVAEESTHPQKPLPAGKLLQF
jgi:hypothetical protein